MSDIDVCAKHHNPRPCGFCVSERIARLESELVALREENARLTEFELKGHAPQAHAGYTAEDVRKLVDAAGYIVMYKSGAIYTGDLAVALRPFTPAEPKR